MSGMTLEKLKVVIEAYTKPYKDEMDKIRQKTKTVTNQVEKETSKIRNAFGRTAGIIGTVLSAAAIVSFGKSCVELGSNLAEVQNVVDVTFGDMNRQVDAFAKNSMKQFGLSELSAKKYMGTYGAMAKSFGIVEEAGFQMSAAITGLTGDVASFYNLTTDEAYTKLKSIFTGETESLKDLGVVMTQTALDQYALNEGFGKTTANMTEQEKVMLRYRFVMSSLSDASGDFARTSNSWANQVRVLQLQFESLKATIGQGLINALTPVIQVINTILSKLQTLAAYFKAFTAALFGDAGGGSAITDASDALGSAAGSSGAVADNMGSAAKAAKDMKKSLAAFDELNNLSSGSSSGGGGAGGAGAVDFGSMSGELFGDVTVNPEIETATDKIRDAVEDLREAAGPAREALQRLWEEGLDELGTFSWTALQDFWEYFLKPLGGWALGEGFPRFVDITNDFLNQTDWDRLNEALEIFWRSLEPFAENIGEGALWFYESVLAPFGEWAMETALPEILELIATALDAVNKTSEVVGPMLEELYHVILEPFGEWLEEVFIDSLEGWKKAFEEIGELLSTHEELAAAITGIAIGIGLLTLALNANPFTVMVLGLTAVAIGIGYVIEHWDEIVEAFSDGWKSIASYFTEGWKSIKSWWTNSAIVVWWKEDVAPWFTKEKWNGLYTSVKDGLKETWDDTVGQWKKDVGSWWSESVEPWFALEKWKSIMREVPSAFGDIFRDAVNAGVKQLNKLIDWVNDKLNFDFDGLEIMGEQIIPAFNVRLFRIPHIPTFAEGGFPSTGQLFIANESGPELVGRIGSRTAVANADQIVDAVARGVFMAISGAGMADEETMYRAFKRAFEEVRPEAVMDSDRAFKNIQTKAAEFRKRTGKPAFA